MNAMAVDDHDTTDVSDAAGLRREVFSDALIDHVLAETRSRGLELTGKDGFLNEMLKAVLERGMGAELTEYLGREAHARGGDGNYRNGTSRKTVATEVGPVELDQPRDRQGSFASQLVPKGARRLGGLEDQIISLYAGGMTVREIEHHLARTLGVELSHESIANVTDAVLDEVAAWQHRPLEAFYPVVFLDAIHIKIRDGAHVKTRAAHIAVGVDLEGVKHVLGIWVQAKEGAAFWASVCAELANRGVKDVLIVACDGLTGLSEAIAATWPFAEVQTCVVHLIRASMRFVSYGDRKNVAKALKPIYTAANAEAARAALEAFAESPLGAKYPTAVRSWEAAWERFIPFLAFGPATRKLIYTTNSIESLNYQLRKITKNRGHFPSDAAAIKLLWLAIRNIEDRRDRERAKDAQRRADGHAGPRKSIPRLVEGATIHGWRAALAELALAYPERFDPHM